MSNHEVHQVHEALERLADEAGHDPMPNLTTGIRAAARRNPNRAAALTGAGLAAPPAYVGFLDPGMVDLDDSGGAEILVLASGGGENGLINVWTWSSGRLARAIPDPGRDTDLASEAGLSTGSEELGAVFQDGELFSWQVVTAGHEVNVWRWTLD